MSILSGSRRHDLGRAGTLADMDLILSALSRAQDDRQGGKDTGTAQASSAADNSPTDCGGSISVEDERPATTDIFRVYSSSIDECLRQQDWQVRFRVQGGRRGLRGGRMEYMGSTSFNDKTGYLLFRSDYRTILFSFSEEHDRSHSPPRCLTISRHYVTRKSRLSKVRRGCRRVVLILYPIVELLGCSLVVTTLG